MLTVIEFAIRLAIYERILQALNVEMAYVLYHYGTRSPAFLVAHCLGWENLSQHMKDQLHREYEDDCDRLNGVENDFTLPDEGQFTYLPDPFLTVIEA